MHSLTCNENIFATSEIAVARTASCACGSLSIVVNGEPYRVAICNCLQCQKRSGSAFGISSFFKKGDIISINGSYKVHQRKALETRTVEEHYCPECGSTVFWHATAAPDAVVIAVVCFAEPHFPAPTMKAQSLVYSINLVARRSIPHHRCRRSRSHPGRARRTVVAPR